MISKTARHTAIPLEKKRTELLRAVKTIPFINCGNFSISIVNAHHDVFLEPRSARYHKHPFYEFSLVRQGVMAYRTRKRENVRGPGEVHFMTPYCEHAWVIRKTPVVIDNYEIEFHANNEAFLQIINTLPDLISRRGYTLALSHDTQKLYKAIDDEIIRDDALLEHHVPLIIYLIFHAMVRENFPEWLTRTPPSGSSDRTFRLFLLAKSIIDENMKTAITPRTVAEQMHITPRYLNELFSTVAQKPCGQYIKDHKLLRAYNMITSDPTIKIREVANALGFIDPLYFTRIFTKHFGVSPTTVRELPRV